MNVHEFETSQLRKDIEHVLLGKVLRQTWEGYNVIFVAVLDVSGDHYIEFQLRFTLDQKDTMPISIYRFSVLLVSRAGEITLCNGQASESTPSEEILDEIHRVLEAAGEELYTIQNLRTPW